MYSSDHISEVNVTLLVRRATVLALAIALLPPVAAEIIREGIDPTRFGRLDQDETACSVLGCGATAAVNSFVYLERQYPHLYGGNLILGDGPEDRQSLIDTADALASEEFMNTDPMRGTHWTEFISGKQKWIEEMASGSTIYRAQSGMMWNNPRMPPRPKPPYVDDSTFPGPTFLGDQLHFQEDVEILLDSPDFAHWITLVGIEYDTVLQEGEINFIDPKTGTNRSARLYQTGADPHLTVDYLDPETGDTRMLVVSVAVSESPVPEPQTAFLAGSAIAALVILRVKSARRPSGSCRS
jgi:hypothetical protein